MTVTKVAAVTGVGVYVFLWVLAFNGVTSLIAPLAIPAILAILVAILVFLQRVIGITPRSPRYREHPDDEGGE